jgi:hypothetical protein
MKDSVRKKIMERDSGACWHCGTNDNVQIHHRTNRGMGGSKLLDRPSNLVVVCAEYNYAMESDFISARSARDLGHKVSRHASIIHSPIRHFMGKWYLLDDRYQKYEVEPNELREDG